VIAAIRKLESFRKNRNGGAQVTGGGGGTIFESQGEHLGTHEHLLVFSGEAPPYICRCSFLQLPTTTKLLKDSSEQLYKQTETLRGLSGRERAKQAHLPSFPDCADRSQPHKSNRYSIRT
jgi:hypothetical protein